MTDRSRIQCKAVADKVVSAEDAAALISSGDRIGMSGFTGSGHPKAVPAALVRRAVVPWTRPRAAIISLLASGPRPLLLSWVVR
jgi:succinyl-CoA:acetate CoA-transferase